MSNEEMKAIEDVMEMIELHKDGCLITTSERFASFSSISAGLTFLPFDKTMISLIRPVIKRRPLRLNLPMSPV